MGLAVEWPGVTCDFFLRQELNIIIISVIGDYKKYCSLVQNKNFPQCHNVQLSVFQSCTILSWGSKLSFLLWVTSSLDSVYKWSVWCLLKKLKCYRQSLKYFVLLCQPPSIGLVCWDFGVCTEGMDIRLENDKMLKIKIKNHSCFYSN